MSQENVDRLITKLMSDEEWRIRFTLDRFQTIADLHECGLALTPTEIDLFVQSDVDIWSGEHFGREGRVH
jgi:hypothetical protein